MRRERGAERDLAAHQIEHWKNGEGFRPGPLDDSRSYQRLSLIKNRLTPKVALIGEHELVDSWQAWTSLSDQLTGAVPRFVRPHVEAGTKPTEDDFEGLVRELEQLMDEEFDSFKTYIRRLSEALESSYTIMIE